MRFAHSRVRLILPETTKSYQLTLLLLGDETRCPASSEDLQLGFDCLHNMEWRLRGLGVCFAPAQYWQSDRRATDRTI
jgi:hypothetical protein